MAKRRKRRAMVHRIPPHKGPLILTETLPIFRQRLLAEISKAMGLPRHLLLPARERR